MKKRKIIILSSIAAVLIILIGTISSLFNLKYINVEILAKSEIVESYGAGYAEGIVESGEFPYGSNTLFSSYVDSKNRIEKAYPFVKVEKMVRKFPNKMTIYVSGRIPELLIIDENHSNVWYAVDYDMKIVHVLTSSVEIADDLYYGLPIVRGVDVSNFSVGDFLTPSIETNCMIGILDGIYGESASPSSVMSDITIDKTGEKCVITLSDRGQPGATISISGFSYMKEKVFTAYHHYKTTYETDDINFPNKSDIDLRVGTNFIPNVNESITMHDRRDDE